MKTVIMYEPGDLLTVAQAADHFGYSRDYFHNMTQLNDKGADVKLIRLRIETDESWRRANRSRAHFVFEYSALKAWYDAKQRRSSVKSKAWARRNTPSPVL
jgi:thioester reductase-like protein